jgi:hypothetical protein
VSIDNRRSTLTTAFFNLRLGPLRLMPDFQRPAFFLPRCPTGQSSVTLSTGRIVELYTEDLEENRAAISPNGQGRSGLMDIVNELNESLEKRELRIDNAPKESEDRSLEIQPICQRR